jgi:hypothetical protein
MKCAIILGLTGSLLVASPAYAQQPRRHPGDTSNRATMMTMMDSSDARLDRLVRVMNQATGPRKVPAMAAVINELVAQRKAMRSHAREMMEMRGMMDQPGGEHKAPSRMQDMQRLPADTGKTQPDTADHSQNHQP